MDDAPGCVFRFLGTELDASFPFIDLSEFLGFGLVGKRKSHLVTGLARLNPNGNRTPLYRGRGEMLHGKNEKLELLYRYGKSEPNASLDPL